MKCLIEFIYNGEVNIYQDHLAELLRVANILKIKGLDELPPSQLNERNDEVGNRQGNDVQNSNTSENSDAPESTLVPAKKRVKVEDSTNQKDPSPSGTSDQVKTAKKRKSVSFSDTPEFVCDQFTKPFELYGENSGNGKRKLRSLSDICSITKVKTEKDENAPDDFEQSNKNEIVVTINPHSLYSSTESIDTDNRTTESSPRKPSTSTSRKMIRKNENFLRALEAVRDEGIGFCKAAKLHGVNNRTLWLEYQKLGYPMKNARKKSQP